MVGGLGDLCRPREAASRWNRLRFFFFSGLSTGRGGGGGSSSSVSTDTPPTCTSRTPGNTPISASSSSPSTSYRHDSTTGRAANLTLPSLRPALPAALRALADRARMERGRVALEACEEEEAEDGWRCALLLLAVGVLAMRAACVLGGSGKEEESGVEGGGVVEEEERESERKEVGWRVVCWVSRSVMVI